MKDDPEPKSKHKFRAADLGLVRPSKQPKPRKRKHREPRYYEIPGGGFETNRRKH